MKPQTDTKAKDMTEKLPKRIIWRDALRFLDVGEFFKASQADRTSIGNQMTYLKENESLEFTTTKIDRTTFKVTRKK